MKRIQWMVLMGVLGGLMAVPRAGLAWGPEGHAVIAHVAEQYLTPEAKKQVKEILGSKRLDDYKVCCWADIIRGDREYELKYPGNGRWHYIDFDASKWYDEDFELTPPDDGQDIVSQIERWQTVLASADSTPDQRLDALRFLTHFVADLHQPLHCAYRYGDMGGNMIPVHSFQGRNYSFDADTPMDSEPNLHAMWDEYLVKELLGDTRPRAFADRMVEEITPEQVRYWQERSVLDWAVDSYWRARKNAYHWTDGTKLPYKWARPGMDLTSENYIDSHLPLVAEQLKKGGVRLAYVLNRALDPGFAPDPGAVPAEAGKSAE